MRFEIFTRKIINTLHRASRTRINKKAVRKGAPGFEFLILFNLLRCATGEIVKNSIYLIINQSITNCHVLQIATKPQQQAKQPGPGN
jgi:hypothetical protein